MVRMLFLVKAAEKGRKIFTADNNMNNLSNSVQLYSLEFHKFHVDALILIMIQKKLR